MSSNKIFEASCETCEYKQLFMSKWEPYRDENGNAGWGGFAEYSIRCSISGLITKRPDTWSHVCDKYELEKRLHELEKKVT